MHQESDREPTPTRNAFAYDAYTNHDATVPFCGGATAMALQADGKIVLVGGMTLARYNSDGTRDPTFGAGGEVHIVFNGGAFDKAQGLAIQADGRIVVVGFTQNGGQDDFAIARFEASGTLDSTFGTGGMVMTDFNGTADQAWVALVMADGRIVVAGNAGKSSPLGVDMDFAAARYTSTGVLDPSFGSGGKVTTDIAGHTDLARAASLQVDDRIVIAGRVADGGGDNPDVGLVRYNVDGSLDTTFGTTGIVRSDVTHRGDWDEATGIAMQPDGRMVVSVAALVGNAAPTTMHRRWRFKGTAGLCWPAPHGTDRLSDWGWHG